MCRRYASLFLCSLCVSLLMAVDVHSISVEPPHPYVICAGGGKVYLRVSPGDRENNVEPRAELYRILHTGKDTLLWRSEGWWARSSSLYLSGTGEHLVRLPTTVLGYHSPNAVDLGVAFYKKGELLARYSTLELLPELPEATGNPGSPPPPPREWYNLILRSYEPTFDYRGGNFRFHFVTVDSVYHLFDCDTGMVLETRRLE